MQHENGSRSNILRHRRQHRELYQGVGLQHFFQIKVRRRRHERDRLHRPCGQNRHRAIVHGQRIVVAQGRNEFAPFSGDFLKHLPPGGVGLQRERHDIDDVARQLQLETTLHDCIGMIDDFAQHLVADRIDKASADLELRDADIVQCGADDNVRRTWTIGIPSAPIADDLNLAMLLPGDQTLSQRQRFADPGRAIAGGNRFDGIA